MKKLALLVSLVLGLAGLSQADSVVTAGPGAAPVPPATSGTSSIYYHIGALNLTIPWDNVNIVYLYDLEGKRNLVGGEAVVISLWRIQGTVGAVTSLDGNGAPFIGGNIWFDNPIPSVAILSQIKPGVFGGYSWVDGAAIFGFKAAFPIFN